MTGSRTARLGVAAARAGLRVALLVDPRFPGGTGTAVAAEIRALAPHVDLAVFGLATAMFRGRPVNPAIAGALQDVGLTLLPEPSVVHADTIVLHNPACLRFDSRLGPRLSASRVIVVPHENFVRPGGNEGFDIAHCLGLIAAQVTGAERLVAPVSASNRAGVATWLALYPALGWRLARDNWSNICDQTLLAPTPAPRDRRGRHSRPGLEKFPPLPMLHAQFPEHAEFCTILGADNLLAERAALPEHWHLLPFGAVEVATFLSRIDFFVYYTHPLWRESFGRAIAEAVAAGKLVVTDPATAEPFGSGVVADDGGQIDAIVAAHIADPSRYAAAVRRAQLHLAAHHRPRQVGARLIALLQPDVAVDALL